VNERIGIGYIGVGRRFVLDCNTQGAWQIQGLTPWIGFVSYEHIAASAGVQTMPRMVSCVLVTLAVPLLTTLPPWAHKTEAARPALRRPFGDFFEHPYSKGDVEPRRGGDGALTLGVNRPGLGNVNTYSLWA
jgi:hypothetical protein